MQKSVRLSRIRGEHLLTFGVLLALLAYTYAKIFVQPYAGIFFSTGSGRIERVIVESGQDSGLRDGDRMLKVGSTPWEDYVRDLRFTVFGDVQPGQVLTIQVERQAGVVDVDWAIPGPNRVERLFRFNSVLTVAYFFWLAGAAALLLIRPRDTRWRLLLTFFFLTALWLGSGALSGSRVWGSAIVLRMAIWLCVPFYLHFHWLFPSPLRAMPAWFWPTLYVAAGSLAGLQFFQLLPSNAYLLGFVVALSGSLVLLALHAIFQPDQRADIALVAAAAVVAFVPLAGLGIAGLITEYPYLANVSFLALPLLPGAYFVAIFRRQAAGMTFRLGRLVALYLFVLMFLTLSALIFGLLAPQLDFPGATILAGILGAALALFFALGTYPRFQRWVERKVLRMPLPPAELLERYADRISTSLDRQTLVQLLKGQILPSLLVRQSALYQYEGQNAVRAVYTQGLDEGHAPLVEPLPPTGQAVAGPDLTEAPVWAHLAVPLAVGGENVGIWLLGRRDPDDRYSPVDIPTFQALANQTAVALQNIAQSEQLRALYQASINERELERNRLARELHDDVLNELVVLGDLIVDTEASARHDETYHSITDKIRRIIHGLRPAMLHYGLYPALEELVDDLSERAGSETAIWLNVSASDCRYGGRVEQHIFRIVQQACENALQHAGAAEIQIDGRLDSESLSLSVLDDGVGFAVRDPIDLTRLLEERHFGLATMFERAALIGATVELVSAPDEGTQVSVAWRKDQHQPE